MLMHRYMALAKNAHTLLPAPVHTVTLDQGPHISVPSAPDNVLLVLRRFNSVFEPEIPGQTAAESVCLAKPI